MPSPPNRLDLLNALPLPAFRAKLWPEPEPDSPSTSPNLPLTTSTSHPAHRLRLLPSASLSPAEFTSCFRLVRGSSAGDYGASAAGWRPGRKRREMRLRDLRYVLLERGGGAGGEGEREEGGGGGGCLAGQGEGEREKEKEEEKGGCVAAVGGFLSFMLTWEDGVEVVYCYEIHLEEGVRGKGWGRRLMGLLEEVGRRAGVEKAMLTVFRRNEAAVRFYERLGYGEDEFSPRPKKLRSGVAKEVDYLIMSKALGGGVKEHEQQRQRKRKAG